MAVSSTSLIFFGKGWEKSVPGFICPLKQKVRIGSLEMETGRRVTTTYQPAALFLPGLG